MNFKIILILIFTAALLVIFYPKSEPEKVESINVPDAHDPLAPRYREHEDNVAESDRQSLGIRGAYEEPDENRGGFESDEDFSEYDPEASQGVPADFCNVDIGDIEENRARLTELGGGPYRLY